MEKDEKIVFSGIQPSGKLNIANYIGALSQWPNLQDEDKCIFCVVDYHAITVKKNPKELRKRVIETAKIYLAAGIDSEKSIIFKQSDVSAHTELAWILNCIGARISDLNKMTQFKDKTGENKESASVGLYDYPVLMAADILLYGTEVVPVGEDQIQHVELARDIAKRVNNTYGDIFTIPKAVVKKDGARIMSLLDPSKKMSKSDENENNAIALLDKPEVGRKKIMKAVTDSNTGIYFNLEDKPAISNLLNIYAGLGNREVKRLVKDHKDSGYGEFKNALADVVENFLITFQEKYNSYSDENVLEILEKGKERAEKIAQERLNKLKNAIGII
ncbi:MAG: tryptophan--tRNA ligase [Patescibacteria group bacterium]|jgi:tryptophanyl-tRNA synthetase|nr:tryptophan--tRNA ligase [Patescibacteria group bacterium]